MNRVLQQYKDEVVAKLTEQFGYTTVMQVPKIDKIVVNMGVGDAISNSKLLDAAVEDLAQITGQKPLVTKAKKSIAVFKLREGMSIGAKVTLRGESHYLVLGTSVVLTLTHLMEEEIIQLVLKNN